MRRITTVLACLSAAALAVGLGAAPAQARPMPPDTKIISLLLTKDEMVKAAGYSGTLVDIQGETKGSCYAVPSDKSKDCVYMVQPGDWSNSASYPYAVYIAAFPTAPAMTKHWTSHVTVPKPYSGETITIVTKTASLVTWYAIPSDPAQMAWSTTSIKGRQGIMSAQCGANTTTPDLTALAECSKKVATALVTKVKKARPKTSLA